jgi:hypothetical protein
MKRLLSWDPFQSPASLRYGVYIVALLLAAGIVALTTPPHAVTVGVIAAVIVLTEVGTEVAWRRRERAREARNPDPWSRSS